VQKIRKILDQDSYDGSSGGSKDSDDDSS